MCPDISVGTNVKVTIGGESEKTFGFYLKVKDSINNIPTGIQNKSMKIVTYFRNQIPTHSGKGKFAMTNKFYKTAESFIKRISTSDVAFPFHNVILKKYSEPLSSGVAF